MTEPDPHRIAAATENLAVAAQAVLENWDDGDLAAAVRRLAFALLQLRTLAPTPPVCGERAAPDTPKTPSPGDPA